MCFENRSNFYPRVPVQTHEMPFEKRRVFSIGSWSPALRMLLTSGTSTCGCVVGVYQVWAGTPVSVVDFADAHCPHRHRQGDVIDDPSAAAAEHP